MLNQIVLVGRIAKEVEVVENGDKKYGVLNIAIPRSFKNANGEYETDFIDIKIWGSIASNTKEYCRKGDIVGIKGRIQSNMYENALGEREYKMEIIGEKVTFLSSKSKNESEDE